MSFGYWIAQSGRAELIARTAHIHHMRAGEPPEPYSEHLRRVAGNFPPGLARVAAWLHDSVEDTELELLDLATLGVDSDAIAVVRRLTHPHKITESDYLALIEDYARATDPLSDVVRWVKVADIRDNLGAVTRLRTEGRDRLADRLELRYTSALEILGVPHVQ